MPLRERPEACSRDLEKSEIIEERYVIPGGSQFNEIGVELRLYKNWSERMKGRLYGKGVFTYRYLGKAHVQEFSLTDRSYEKVRQGFFTPWVLSDATAHLANPKQARILEIGCGRYGLFAQGLNQEGFQITGIDPAAALDAPSYIVRASATKMPFQDGEFDLLISLYSIFEYTVPQDPFQLALFQEEMREMIRVLKPGGSILSMSIPGLDNWVEKNFPELEVHVPVDGAGHVRMRKRAQTKQP